MSDSHLKALNNRLENDGWLIEQPFSTDEPPRWELSSQRSNYSSLSLVFDCIDDLEYLPLSECYGCKIEGSSIELYFSRISSRQWIPELDRFLMELTELARERNSGVEG